jgi:hypothetical protein
MKSSLQLIIFATAKTLFFNFTALVTVNLSLWN